MWFRIGTVADSCVKTVMNLRVPWKAEVFLSRLATVSCSRTFLLGVTFCRIMMASPRWKLNTASQVVHWKLFTCVDTVPSSVGWFWNDVATISAKTPSTAWPRGSQIRGPPVNFTRPSDWFYKVKGTGVPVLFFKLGTTPWRYIGEWRYTFTHSLTSILDGREWLASRHGRFTPRERDPVPIG
jgi:hypothetical protein